MTHIKYFCHAHQCFETDLFVSKYQEQESSNKIHSLAVLYFWVEECICFQNIVKNFRFYNMSEIVERSLDIHCNKFSNRVFKRLSLIYFTVIFECSTISVFAIYLISESIVIFRIRINT